ncbi:MAG: hypothetical protein VB089_08475 [Anaerolineaceae bacterium]|nr:hypothetical protein [Anaerolineaceae bacterium]
MSEFLHNLLIVLPLLVVLVLILPPFKAHILVAGLVGGAVAIVVGGLPLGQATTLFTNGIVSMLTITSVVLFASTAMVLARAGSISSTLNIIKRIFQGRLQWIAAAMVLVQAFSVYGAGHGAANTLVTAPLVFAAVGFNPLTIVGMSIVSGASWATSPASAESGIISQAMGWDVQTYANFMLPFTVTFWLIGAVLAFIGVSRALKNGTLKPGEPPQVGAATDDGTEQVATQKLLGDQDAADWKRSLPFFVLLFLIIVGPFFNRWVGVDIFTNLVTPLLVLGLAGFLLKIKINEMAEEFVSGSRPILRYLFLVGVFLGFVNLMTEIGTFNVLASLPAGLPASLIGVSALVIAFLIAIPSASYTAAIDAIILPVLAAAGVPPQIFGFVGVIVAQGAMMSPVQVNVAATGFGFRATIIRIVQNNAPYMPLVAIVTILMSLVASAL